MEALKVTSKAKALFKNQSEDLFNRGDELVRSSVEAGVTCMRAHVEVDRIVDDVCINVGIRLKAKWSGTCDIQLSCKFVQPC